MNPLHCHYTGFQYERVGSVYRSKLEVGDHEGNFHAMIVVFCIVDCMDIEHGKTKYRGKC